MQNSNKNNKKNAQTKSEQITIRSLRDNKLTLSIKYRGGE